MTKLCIICIIKFVGCYTNSTNTHRER